MSTHNIPLSIYKKKTFLNMIMSSAMGVFPRDSRTSSKEPW